MTTTDTNANPNTDTNTNTDTLSTRPPTVADHAETTYSHLESRAAAHAAARFNPKLREARVMRRLGHLHDLSRDATKPLLSFIGSEDDGDLLDRVASAIRRVEGDLIAHGATGHSLLNLTGGRLPRRGSTAFPAFGDLLDGHTTPSGVDFILAALAAYAEIEGWEADPYYRDHERRSALRPILERLSGLLRDYDEYRHDEAGLSRAITTVARLYDGCATDVGIREILACEDLSHTERY